MEKILKTYRHEKKYTLNWNEFQIINGKLKHLLALDKNCPPTGYEVKSLYFDNPYDHALGQKIEGLERRHKYRLRVYNNNFSFLKLEKKSKHNVMTNKESMLLDKEDAINIVNGNIDYLQKRDNDFLQNFYYKIHHEKYVPKIIVKYKRIAYVFPISNLRITFDYHLKTSSQTDKFFSTENGYMDVIDPNEVIMEIKFDHVLPTFIRDAIQSPTVMASSSSKYVAARFI